MVSFQNDLFQLLLVDPLSQSSPLFLAVSFRQDLSEFRVVARELTSSKRVYKFSCPLTPKDASPLPVVLTPDGAFICALGWESAKDRSAIHVFHSRRGILLHRIAIK